MADSWSVTFTFRWLSSDDRQSVRKEIPRSVTATDGTEAVVTVLQGAPTALDAANRVGSKLRMVLDRSRLNVTDVKVRPV